MTLLPPVLQTVRALAMAALVGLLLLLLVPSAQGGTRAQGEIVRASACTLNGPRWTVYDSHGGANPKQVGSGTLYDVFIQVFNSPGSYSCAWAKAAVKKMFPENMKRQHTAVVLRSGPVGFVCRSSGGGPPEIGAGGRCVRAPKPGTITGVIVIWQPVGVR